VVMPFVVKQTNGACNTAFTRLRRLRLVYSLDTIESLAQVALRDLNIVIGLQIEPKLRRRSERLGEPTRESAAWR